jgi:hypothetical protein
LIALNRNRTSLPQVHKYRVSSVAKKIRPDLAEERGRPAPEMAMGEVQVDVAQLTGRLQMGRAKVTETGTTSVAAEADAARVRAKAEALIADARARRERRRAESSRAPMAELDRIEAEAQQERVEAWLEAERVEAWLEAETQRMDVETAQIIAEAK